MASPNPIISPVAQHSFIPERNALVTAAYVGLLQGGHHGGMAPDDESLSALVTFEDVQIVEAGEGLTLGLVPLENRYAIGPIINGRAEVLPQHEFEPLHSAAYLEWYAIAKHPPGDCGPGNYVPWVKRFVAQKVDPLNTKGLVPLGTGLKTERQEPTEFWSEKDQRMVPIAELKQEEVEDPRDAKLAEMKKQIDMLVEAQGNAPAPPVVESRGSSAPHYVCACGKEFKDGRGIASHNKICDSAKQSVDPEAA